MIGWDSGKRAEAQFLIDPMPSRISTAYSSLIFGRSPEITTEDESDQGRMDDLAEGNNFRSEFSRAARTASSEGEVWWRWRVDPKLADVPVLEWFSRTAVYPLWIGSRLAAVAFINRLSDTSTSRWRLFEIHEVDPEVGGRVEHVLYREPRNTTDSVVVTSTGDKTEEVFRLGERVALTAHPEAENLAVEWVHGLPSLIAGRIVNMFGSDPKIGVSDYFDPEDYLLELDVIASIAHANLELTARKRAIVPIARVDGETGAVDLGEQVLVPTTADRGMPGETAGKSQQFQILEYEFDADALVTWKREAERTAVTRAGLDLQYTGVESADGRADSGTALRIRLIPSVAAGEERAGDWDFRLPQILTIGQQLDHLPPGDQENLANTGGFGRPWAKPDEPPSVNRGSSLPEDRTEGTERRSTAVGAKIMSIETAVREDHPDWSDDEVKNEIGRIGKDAQKEAELTGSAFRPTIPAKATGGETAQADGGDQPLADPGP